MGKVKNILENINRNRWWIFIIILPLIIYFPSFSAFYTNDDFFLLEISRFESLGEFFNFTLFETIALQRILIVIINEICEHEYSIKLKRIGDDLFYKNNAKLSVSIATKSPVSTLIHVGINIETKGTPVKTVGLQELKIPPKEFSLKVLEHFSGEIESMKFAKCKVRPVN